MRNLLVWFFLTTNVFAQPVPPGGDNSATNNESPLNSVSDYGTNLWLSISLSNNAVQLLLHNTQPGVPYFIRSRQDLVSGSWFFETAVTGTVAATTTPASLRTSGATNSLFVQALTWVTNATSKTIVMLAIGDERIMKLTAEGDVICWGGNQYGELGDYTFLDSTNPVHVAGLTGVTKIASGLYHSLALDLTGTVWAWGQNNFGQLGDDDVSDADIPVQVSGMTNVIAIDARGYNGEGLFGFSSAVRADGTVWMWGLSECIAGGGYVPVQVPGISNARAVAIGDCYGLALLTNGAVWMWGNGNEVPGPVGGLSNMVAVCAGESHSLALASNGTVWAWGYNDSGQLGDGKTEYYRPVPVMVAGLTNVIGIAAGARHSLAVEAQGRLWAWGYDGYGQLGDGGFAGIVSRPLRVPGISNIVTIAAGPRSSAALDGDGNLWQWGGNDEYPGLSPAYVDFYNGQLPRLQILSGNHQAPHTGLEFPQPLVFKVTDAKGTALSNAPVSVEVISGDMEFRTANGGSNHRGLRLTTDANGEVSLIGYADRYAGDTNCLMRVLAASRERIVEVDFSETLILPPSVNITSPIDGATILVSSNQSLTITVDAEAAPGASIQEVNYSYQANGGEETPLGFSAQSPYSFTWTDAIWWTNAFVSQYTITAMAVDDAGMQSDPQSVNITVALDSEGEGMPDYWQLQYFAHLGVDPNADSDGDGYSNWQEYQYNIDPTDFYNGRLPYLELLGGNDQAGNYESFLPKPVSIKVSGSQFFNTFIPNAPVTFTVTNGTALLAATTNDIPTKSIVVRSDLNGQVSAWVYFPPYSSGPPDSTILASAISGTSRVTITVSEFVPLGHWRFNDTNTWAGEAGQLPLSVANVTGTHSWSGDAVFVPGVNPAFLSYQVVETNGATNVTCQTGSVLFWFKPDWSSASVGGNGPGAWGRLLEMGNYNPAFTNGWWSLYLNPDGTQLSFGTSTNGGGMTNLSATILWCSNEWYQIALTYSPVRSALYVDGQLLASGAGVIDFPNADELLNGFRIGSDCEGNNQADGAFDELRTFNYPLAAANAATYSGCIPDWWEVKYFGRNGMDPDSVVSEDGFTLWISYWCNRDPNVINFSLSAANQFVNHSIVPVQINIQNGEPSAMAVAINTTNFVVDPYQLFNPGNNFIATPWQPYNSNIVVSLNSGEHDYYVWVGLKGPAPDAGQTWHATRLTLDTTPPVLTITNPPDGIASRPIIQMQGCANESMSSLTYDISNAAGVWTNQTAYITGQFCDMNLLAITTNYFQGCNIILESNGVNIITLHAIDLAGNETSTNFVFTFDPSANTNPPVLTVLWPQTGTSIGGSNFTLQAQVSDPMTTVTASIVDGNGNESTVPGLVEQSGSAWVEDLPLGSGTNTLTVVVTDMVGNTCTTNLILFRSGVIVTLDPLSNDQFNQSFINVSGTVSDSSCAITVNGAVANVNADGTWEADSVPTHASGTALLDVEAASSESGSSSQMFAATQPVKVGLMSYLKNEAPASGLIGGGIYCAVSPCCGPAYGNNGNTIKWNYQAGGSDSGYNYSSGYFNSGPGAPGSIMISAPGYFDWSNVLPSGQDAYGAPWEIRSDAQGYYQTQVMIESEGKKAAGTMVTYLVQAQVWGNQLAPGLLRINGVPLMDDGMGSGHIIFSAPADLNMNVTPIAPGNYSFAVQATDLNFKLALDNNRDGQITLYSRDATTPARPFRFWINDSKESGDISSADDNIPGSDTEHLKAQFPFIRGASDLVNYFPVVLCLSNALQLSPTRAGYEYHLSQKDGAVVFVYTDLSCTNAYEYLNSPEWWATTHGNDLYSVFATHVTPSPGVTMNEQFLGRILANGGKGVILVEGIKATQQPLELEIWYNGQKLASFPLYLNISPIEDLYRHLDLRDGPDAATGLVGEPSSRDWAKATQMDEPPGFPDYLSNGKWLVFVHGYNVSGQQARGRESEMFKRVYWSHSRSRFVGVSWFGDPQSRDGDYLADYHWAVMNAFATAPKLAEKIGALPGPKTIVAHSLGCGLVASAIVDHGLTVDHACFLDAALAAECFDGDAAEDLPNMAHPLWVTSSNLSQPYYPRELWASDWYKLFVGTDDARKSLTWKDRFANLVVMTDVHSFFSSTEDVLAPCPGMPGSDMLQSLLTSGLNGAYAWAIQEKGKGNAISVPWAIQAGSDYGGWGFNLKDPLLNGDPVWYAPYVSGGTVIGRRVKTMDEIGVISEDLLLKARWTPLFKTGWGRWDGSNPTNVVVNTSPAYYSGPSWIFDLYARNATGSNVAAVPANRAQLLAEAIPALSTPTGSRFVTKFGARRNYDMPVQFADQSNWPRGAKLGTQIPDWRHGDVYDVAYPYLHNVYTQIASISEQ